MADVLMTPRQRGGRQKFSTQEDGLKRDAGSGNETGGDLEITTTAVFVRDQFQKWCFCPN